jgi:hypothetical protein
VPNLTPSDVHVNTEVNSEGVVPPRYKHPFSSAMDKERRVRFKAQKRKVKQIGYTPDWVEKRNVEIQKKFHSAKNRRKLAAQGDALPNNSYPIEDTEDLKNAATLARSGHGDVGAARRLIARRARELGVANPLAKKEKVGKSFSALTPFTDVFSRLTE